LNREITAGEKMLRIFSLPKKSVKNHEFLTHQKPAVFDSYDFLGIRMLRFANTPKIYYF
jgi:hypothetical protein